jgi:hypothetical protein
MLLLFIFYVNVEVQLKVAMKSPNNSFDVSARMSLMLSSASTVVAERAMVFLTPGMILSIAFVSFNRTLRIETNELYLNGSKTAWKDHSSQN